MNRAVREGSSWRDDVENAEYVRDYVGRMPDIVPRALDAGAKTPLVYVGAGMTSAVFCDSRGRAFKVGRERVPIIAHFLTDEAEWLEAAGRVPGVREHVARLYRFHASLLVIERECPVADDDARWRFRDTTWNLHRLLEDRMIPHGWTAPEYKEDSWVLTKDGPILVDASMPHRVGKVLLRHTRDVLRGQAPVYNDDRPSDFAFSLRMEIGKTITQREAQPLLDELAALEESGNRWQGTPLRNPTAATALRHIDRTAPGVDDGMAHGFPVAPYRVWAAILQSADYQKRRQHAPLATVRLADLHATQDDVERAKVATHLRQPQLVPFGSSDDKPRVARYRGELYIMDGHHRLTALRMRGRRTARVRFVDLDASENPRTMHPLPHSTPEHMPLALKVALGVAGVWGAFAIVNAVFRAKVASAVEGAVPGLTVNPTPPTSITVTPSSKASVQLAASANAASTYDLLSSVALDLPELGDDELHAGLRRCHGDADGDGSGDSSRARGVGAGARHGVVRGFRAARRTPS